MMAWCEGGTLPGHAYTVHAAASTSTCSIARLRAATPRCPPPCRSLQAAGLARCGCWSQQRAQHSLRHRRCLQLLPSACARSNHSAVTMGVLACGSTDTPSSTAASQIAQSGSSLDYQPAPKTFDAAVRVFCSAAAPRIIAVGVMILATLRSRWQICLQDAVVSLCVGGFWMLQEWFVHRWLLHSVASWAGRDIHAGHHALPYFHVSLDGPEVVVPMMFLSAGLAAASVVMGASASLAITGLVSYWAMGLVYEWTHYLCHTRVPLTSGIAKAVKRNHMLHHCRNEDHWMSFTCPPLDHLFGTAPSDPSLVPVNLSLRRQGLAAKADHPDGSELEFLPAAVPSA
eukprot:jgi/Chlat1/59/Chrsp1S03111